MRKWKYSAKKFPDAILSFAKLGDLTTAEKQSLSELVGRSGNLILILTGEDLLRQSHNPRGPADFDELCRRTQYRTYAKMIDIFPQDRNMVCEEVDKDG